MNAVNLNRGMPHDHELERQVLYTALALDEHRAVLCDSLLAVDFYTDVHREVFTSVQTLERSGFDLLSFESTNRGNTRVMDFYVGGHASIMSVDAFAAAVDRLKQLGEARFLGRAALEVGAAVLSGESTIDPSGFLDEAAKRLTAALNSRRSRVEPQTVFEALQPYLTALVDRKPVSPRVVAPSGLEPVDGMLPRGGFASGDLSIVAGRPGMGKTSFAIQVARHAAGYGLRPVLFSYEMSAEDVSLNVLGQEARMPVAAFSRELNEFEAARAIRSAQGLADVPFRIFDCPGVCLEDVANECRALKRKGQLDVVLVDYLQLMRMRADYRSKFEEVSEISRGLKQLARELDIPVIALAQLNRDVEKRANKRPQMSDLAQSGQIECDADNILFLYRDWIYNKEADQRACEVIFDKNRKGRTGPIQLRFDAVTTTFSVVS